MVGFSHVETYQFLHEPTTNCGGFEIGWDIRLNYVEISEHSSLVLERMEGFDKLVQSSVRARGGFDVLAL